jgi:hypothetical protein
MALRMASGKVGQASMISNKSLSSTAPLVKARSRRSALLLEVLAGNGLESPSDGLLISRFSVRV